MNPANSVLTVAWLVSDDALDVTGCVLRAVGQITHYLGWRLGEIIETRGGAARREPADIGLTAVNARIFGPRAPGLQMGG